jgi:hypothetical protein
VQYQVSWGSGGIGGANVMSSEREYRGVEYATTNLGNGKSTWAFYPKMEHGQVQRGEVTGARELAEAACKNAIDVWLDAKKSN